MRKNLEFLLKYGLNRESYENYALVKYTCQILQALKDVKNEDGVFVK